MSALRAALIGYGLAGRVIHRPLLEAVDDLTISHVVTSDPGRQEAVRADAPQAALVASAEELWGRRDEFDVVVVVTSKESHVPLARTAVGIGKAVVVDKPLVVTADGADPQPRRAPA